MPRLRAYLNISANSASASGTNWRPLEFAEGGSKTNVRRSVKEEGGEVHLC